MNTVPLTVVARMPGVPRPRRGEPVSFGLPFPQGLVSGFDRCALVDANGRASAVQADVGERWPDGSVRWGVLHGQVDWPGTEAAYRLVLDGAPATPVAQVSAGRNAAGAVTIDTGVTRFMCQPGSAFPFSRVQNGAGLDVLSIAGSGLRVVDADGLSCDVSIESVDIETAGPLQASVRWRGRVARGRDRGWLEVDARGHFFAGHPTVRLSITIRNPRAAQHPGNVWELGDPGSALIREATLVLTAAGNGTPVVSASVEASSLVAGCDTPFELYQESSGGEHWDSPAHVNRDGRVPMHISGYRLTMGLVTAAGRRASPVVTLESGDTQLAVSVPGFWQNFPRAIEVRDRALRVGLWPRQFPDLHELQGGEQKAHDVVASFGPDPVCDLPLDWCRVPALIRANPEWYCASGAVAHLVPEAADPSAAYRALVCAAIEGSDTFESKRERIDEYGWRNFGEVYADHEAVHAPGGAPLVSHYNNQYDAIAGFAVQFLRTADPRWWTQMDELAAHVVDIDLYHSAEDKAAYSGGPFWHTCHYVDAGRATHRAYPQSPGVAGGGPGNEHNYTGGLVLHHFLTGDPRSREAVVQLADWVLRIDDGRLSPFRWLDRGDTGLASATRDPRFHGPGRGAAHSIATLLDGYRLTGHRAYLDKAEGLIRRCIHPADDIDSLDLLDAENRWSYTVFLQVLGRYLLDCAGRGHRGETYAWARESLLGYGRWMARCERPYLETPERLEHPTETWAAQDLRKADVLWLASLHASDAAEGAWFRERAAYFFQSSVTSLSRMETRTLARPVVILLGNGYRQSWFATHPDARLPGPDGGPYVCGAKAPFMPQRARAVVRAAWIVGTAVVLGAAALVGILLW